jgi:hypothetical protein
VFLGNNSLTILQNLDVIAGPWSTIFPVWSGWNLARHVMGVSVSLGIVVAQFTRTWDHDGKVFELCDQGDGTKTNANATDLVGAPQ